MLAFFLRLFGASPEAAFVEWVYRNAEQAMRPFRGIFPPHELGGTSVLDTSLLFGTVVYFILALLVDAGVHWLTVRLQRQQREVANARVQADAATQAYAAQEHNAEVAAQRKPSASSPPSRRRRSSTPWPVPPPRRSSPSNSRTPPQQPTAPPPAARAAAAAADAAPSGEVPPPSARRE